MPSFIIRVVRSVLWPGSSRAPARGHMPCKLSGHHYVVAPPPSYCIRVTDDQVRLWGISPEGAAWCWAAQELVTTRARLPPRSQL